MEPEELKARRGSGTAATILDARNPKAWDESRDKIQGAMRVDPKNFHPKPSWAKDQLLVAY
jgi:hypothetical protein